MGRGVRVDPAPVRTLRTARLSPELLAVVNALPPRATNWKEWPLPAPSEGEVGAGSDAALARFADERRMLLERVDRLDAAVRAVAVDGARWGVSLGWHEKFSPECTTSRIM